VVDALNEDAARFYLRHGFRRFPSDELKLFHRLQERGMSDR
jgi:hypothetical protein